MCGPLVVNGADEGAEGVGALAAFVQCGAQLSEQLFAAGIEQGEEQLVLTGEVGVERTPRESCFFADIFDACAMEPAIGEHVQRSLHETGTGVFAPTSGASRHEQPSGRDDGEAIWIQVCILRSAFSRGY
ncbi:Uncharacterised protein [Mycobacteroides abscessus subsp. abscessus]|nr:Uncharacterised protein [Mycobacteroides abscessus subsp. abscessus]